MLVCIVTRQRTFLSAGSDRQQTLSQRLLWAFDSESFALLRHRDGSVSLRTCHGTLLSAGGREVGQTQQLLEEERWELLSLPSGWSCLRDCHGRLLRALSLLAGWAVDTLAVLPDETCELELFPVSPGTRTPCAYLCPVFGTLCVPASPMSRHKDDNEARDTSAVISGEHRGEASRPEAASLGAQSAADSPPAETPVVIEGHSRPRCRLTPQRLSSHYAA